MITTSSTTTLVLRSGEREGSGFHKFRLPLRIFLAHSPPRIYHYAITSANLCLCTSIYAASLTYLPLPLPLRSLAVEGRSSRGGTDLSRLDSRRWNGFG